MDKFTISPEDCLILKAFRDSGSLREAAALLSCDPAGLTRRVQSISNRYGFLQKVNNRWRVTPRGLDLVAWVEDSIQRQNRLILAKNSLRIASTMWFSEVKIAPNLPKLQHVLGPDSSFQISSPRKGFEHSLISGAADFVIVCHPPGTPEIEHRQVTEEKWIAVAPSSWQVDFKGKSERPFDALRKKPFLRHSDLNEDLLLPDCEIKESGIVIDHLIGIRSAVRAGLGWSLVPHFLVSREIKEKTLIEIPLAVPINDRRVCVWWLRNRYEIKRQSAKVCGWVKDICS